MIWREILLERAPGVTPGLGLVDCGPGLNVVVGPNGIGKSTLSRAARAALWREEAFDGLHVRARLLRSGEEWTLEREGSAPARWGGTSDRAPALPDARFRDCFHLGLDDLLRLGNTEAAIAHELKLEMSGRFDLDAVCAEERKRSASRHGVPAARRALQEAQSNVDATLRDARELLDEERRLDGLRSRLTECRRDARDESAVADLKCAADYQEKLTGLLDELGEDDPLLSHFESPGDLQRLKQLTDDLATAQDEELAARGELNRRERELNGLALPVDGVDGELTRRGAAHVLRITSLRDTVLPPLREKLTTLDGELSTTRALAGTEELPLEELVCAEDLLEQRQDLRSRITALDRALEYGPGTTEERSGEPWRAVLALLEWCTSGSAEATPPRRLFGLAAFAAAFLTVLLGASAAGMDVPSWVWAVPLVPALVLAWRLRHKSADESPDRAGAKRRYADAGVDAPESWDADGVRRRLESLLEQRVEQGTEAHLTKWSQGLQRERDECGKQDESLAKNENELRTQLGAEGLGDLSLRLLLSALKRTVERNGVAARVSRVEQELADETEALQSVLESVGVGRARDLDVALARWDEFQSRVDRYAPRNEAREAAASAFNGARSRFEKVRGQYDLYLQAHQLDEDSAREALGLAPLLEAYLTRRRVADSLQRDVQAFRERWKARPELLDLNLEALKVKMVELDVSKDGVEYLTEVISEIEAGVKLLRDDTRLTERELMRRETFAALDELRDEVLGGVAMNELLEEVQSRHRREGRSEVLGRAERHFADYTADRYAIDEFDDDGLGVIETATRRRLKPAQLSSGTRTQLLIALRLSYAESVEGDDPLPIFLDEALLTSDPVRFAEIARSLGRMVAEGRQVFYLTAEPREEVEWRRALGTAGTDLRVHDLGGKRDALRRMADSSLDLAPLAEIPEPQGNDGAAYARLLGGLPTIDGFEGCAALHLLQLYWDRPREAWSILRERRSSVGATRQFLESGSNPPWNSEQRARFEARAAIADRVLSLWRVGRAPRLNAEVLRAAKKSTKLDEVVALAEALAWDGDALLTALHDKRVKSLHKEWIAALHEHLEERGYLSCGDPLEFDELLSRVLEGAEASIGAGAIERDEAVQIAHRLFRWLTGGDEPGGVSVNE